MHSAQVFSSEKLRFFKSRCLETFLGASFSLYSSKILSLLLYISPSAIIGFPMFLYNSYYLAINISGLIGLLLLLLVLKLNDPNNNKTIPINSSEQRLFIELKTTKPRKVLILLFLLISTYFYYFLTMSFILETYETNDISYGIRVLELILIHLVTLTSSGSIFFKSPKEFASILPDDRVFNLFSAIFMRPCYVIMILIMKIVYSGYWYNVIISIIYFSLLPLWTFGILGGLMNTGLWGIETLNSILFGDSFKIKHENLIMTFLFNCGISVILTIVLYFNADSICLIFYLILTLASLIKNFDFIKFKRNLKLKRIEMEYLFMPGIILVQVFSVCLGLFNGFTSDNMYFDKKYQIILIVLGAIAGFFCVFNWLEAVFMNRLIALKFWRNCFKKRENCHFLRKTVFRASLIQLSLFFIAMTFARSVALKTMNDKSLLGIWLWSALLLRVFNLCWFFHLKLFLLLVEGIIIVIICQLEPYWVIYFAPLLDIGNGFLFRIVSRTISFFYSLYKMKTTKSLRLENPNKFIILSITLLFPLNFLNILITSLFNIPIIGLFGMPLLFSGSLRPHRLWATLNSSLKPDFEAYIYKAIIEQFKISIPELIYEHPDEFQPEDYYLLRMGKIIGIFNVIERGFNYIGLNFRGLEMQEPTSCHNLESNSIDDIIKSVSNGNRRVFTSLFTIMEPLTPMKIVNYDDNSFKLTGIIENKDFNSGLKELYLKLILFHFQQWFSESPDIFQVFIDSFHLEFSNEIDISDLLDIYPQKWASFLHKSSDSRNFHVKDSKIVLKMPDDENIDTNTEKNKPKEEIIITIKPKVKVEENDMLMLLDDLENINSLRTEFNGKNLKISEEKPQIKIKDREIKKTFEEKLKEVSLHFFAISLNQRSKNLESRINEETLYKLFKDGGLLNLRRWSSNVDHEFLKKAIECCQNSLRFALKIALEIYAIEGYLNDIKDETLKENIEETLRKWFIGNRNSEELFKAFVSKKENLMCLLYDFSKKETNVLRATRNEMQGYIVKLNEDVIKNIWSNMIFELLYATNDDDERYSIQSHPTYLRNLIIQSSEEPLGYCPFYSGPFIAEF